MRALGLVGRFLVRDDVCPNCGALYFDGETCRHCWWSDGDEFFKPHWMDYASWEHGIEHGWNIKEMSKGKGRRRV